MGFGENRRCLRSAEIRREVKAEYFERYSPWNVFRPEPQQNRQLPGCESVDARGARKEGGRKSTVAPPKRHGFERFLIQISLSPGRRACWSPFVQICFRNKH